MPLPLVQPFSGFIADSYGPRKMALAASFLGRNRVYSVLVCILTPMLFYLYYGLGGLGVGVLYGISTACAVKWFPDRRGFAAGLVCFWVWVRGRQFLTSLFRHYWIPKGSVQLFYGSDPAC